MFIFLLISCKKQKDCPPFSSSDLEYIPYETGDSLNFINQQGNAYQIIITGIDQSEAYDYECRDLHGICPCINYAEVISTNTETHDPVVFLRFEQSDVSDMQYFKYQVMDYHFEFDFRNELPYIEDFPFIQFHDSLLVSGGFYYNVVEINNTDDPVSVISKVFFNENHGILKFIEKSGTDWSLLDNN